MDREKDVNRFGLSRYIQAPTRREIRKKCGFGCVVCGSGIYEYEHVDPEFKDAEQHVAECITLLCPGCHGKVTRGQWSKSKIKKHMESPAALTQGFAKDIFDLCDGFPFVRIGGMTLKNCRVPIRIYGKDIFRIDPPQDEGGPFLLSGMLCDKQGRPTLVIDKNEWKASVDSWDITTEGPVIEIRNGPGDIVLRLVASPPNGLTVERLKMNFGAVELEATADLLRVGGPLGGGDFSNCLADNCEVGMDLYPFGNRQIYIDPNLNWAAKMVKFKVVYGADWVAYYRRSLRGF
jgi:hypothetical protein